MPPDAVSPTAFRRLMIRAIVVPSALLVALAIVFLFQIMVLLAAAERVDRSNQQINRALSVVKLFLDGETGMRGYLVTGDPLFLEPYQVAASAIGPAFDAMTELVSNEPIQVARIEALRAKHADWQDYAQQMIELRQDGGDYERSVRNNEGKQRMDGLREQAADFIRAVRDSRDSRSQKVKQTTWTVVGTSIGLTLLIGGLLANFTRRQLLAVSASYAYALTEAESRAESLRRSALRLEVLHEIDVAILAAKSIPELIRSALLRTERIVPDDEAMVVLVDPAGGPNFAISCRDGPEPRLAAQASQLWSVSGASDFLSESNGRSVVDLAAVSVPTPIEARLLAMGYRSCVLTPLQAEGVQFGGLILAAVRPSAFTEEHRQIAVEVSRQLSIAIQQVRMREQLQRSAFELEARVLQRTRELKESLDGAQQRQQILAQSNARIEVLEQKARDLAWFVETTRQQTLLQSDKKTEALEQKARDLANLVESLRNQTRLQSETEIEALGKKARELALFVEAVRKETRLKSEAEIEALGQKAQELAASVESERERTLLQSDSEIAALGQKAQDLAVSVESEREKTLLQTGTEIAALGQQARDLAVTVETKRENTLLQSDIEIAALGQQARDLAVSVETDREKTLLDSELEIKGLKQQARTLAVSVERSRLETLVQSDKVIRKLNEDLERRVLERTEQLEAANKELESFSYSVSHDLRAPLRAIDGFSRIVLEDFAAALPDEGKSYLNLVRSNTRQMGQLVDDLLAFSRLGRQSLIKHTVDSGKMVRLCLAEMHEEQEGRRLDVQIGDLPSCQADPTLLKQVWTNLLSNALKYTRKREAAQIAIGCRTAPRASGIGTETVYFVKDNGAGFDMKYAHKLFGVFQRLHRAADYDGTGVGLAIVQRIINRHGGRIWGEAQLNQGATFSFTLE